MSSRNLWIVLVVAACGEPSALDRTKVTLDGSGSTFQSGAQEIWIEAFRLEHPEITINYGGGGSGKGRQDFADRVVDFACTDTPFEPGDAAKVKGEFFYIPTVLGAIAVVYQLPGNPPLRLSAPTIAGIFQRRITRWNAPEIAAENPGVPLPDLAIVVARRADASGTTENFTRYLSRAATTAWTLPVGASIAWPRDTQAGAGNGGVAQIIKATPGAIGYVDLSDAKASKLSYAAVKNRAGRYVMPDPDSVTAAADAIGDISGPPRLSALDAGGETAYPITAQSWCLVHANQRDPAKGAALEAYFRFMLTDGQALLEDIDFAPLPPRLRDQALIQLGHVRVW